MCGLIGVQFGLTTGWQTMGFDGQIKKCTLGGQAMKLGGQIACNRLGGQLKRTLGGQSKKRLGGQPIGLGGHPNGLGGQRVGNGLGGQKVWYGLGGGVKVTVSVCVVNVCVCGVNVTGILAPAAVAFWPASRNGILASRFTHKVVDPRGSASSGTACS